VLNSKELAELGGQRLLSTKGSFHQLLSTTYPDFDWLPWKFAWCPRNYWNDMKNQRKFIEWAAKELKIEQMSDWYKVTHKVTKFNIFSSS
jgi:hypothetical protein